MQCFLSAVLLWPEQFFEVPPVIILIIEIMDVNISII